MRCKPLIIIAVLLFTVFNFGVADEPYKTYGKEIKPKKVVAFKEAVKNPNKYKNKEILIIGEVTAVCQNKGCWMEIADGREKMRVKFEGYSFFVPYDSKGKKVKVQGKVKRETVDEETFKHWLEDAGESEEVINKIKGDQKVIMMIASGVSIEGGSELSQEQLDVIEGKSKKDDDGHKH